MRFTDWHDLDQLAVLMDDIERDLFVDQVPSVDKLRKMVKLFFINDYKYIVERLESESEADAFWDDVENERQENLTDPIKDLKALINSLQKNEKLSETQIDDFDDAITKLEFFNEKLEDGY